MQAYIIRRLLLMIPTLLIVTMVVFSVARFIPGDIIDQMVLEAGEAVASWAETQEASEDVLRHALGLDVPIHIQYGHWMSGILRGDFGRSLWTGQPIGPDIMRRIPVSLELSFIGMVIGLLIALPIGIYSAIRQDTRGDYLGRSFAIACITIPGFWLGTLVMVFPSVWWNWTPPVQFIPLTKDPIGNLGQFIIPAAIMGMFFSGTTMRMTRTMMLEVLRQDYIRTAWSKGLTERVVIMRHALKNALIPVATLIGSRVPMLISGSVVMERIFCLPGIGQMVFTAITERDYPVISGINLVISVVVLVAILATDLCYGFLDPRVRYE